MDNTRLNQNSQLEANSSYQFFVHTFGCKVNTYDTGLIQKNLSTHGFQLVEKSNSGRKEPHQTPIHVLNTCAVTAEATSQAVRLIRKIKSQDPLATVVVTGCAAQVDTGSFENLPGANLVVANSHKGMLPQLLDQYFKGDLKQKVFKSNIFKKEDLEMGGGEESHHTRNFLKIQDGCNSFCTFCIIPYARGKSRSIPIFQLIQKINQLVDEGAQEVVLTGVHIGDYEDVTLNRPLLLEDLVESVLKKTKIPRLRLSSLEPVELSDRLLDLFSDERLCPHFHMSIQSADSDVLQQMKRKYSEQDVRSCFERIRQKLPNSFIGLDVIAGFPTETEEQFENTYRILSESPWTRMHVFPYSERQGTRAAQLPQLHTMVRKERASLLRQLSLHRLQSEALRQVGTEKKALILNKWNTDQQGLTRDYWSVDLGLSQVDHDKYKNTEIPVLIQDVFLKDNDVVLKGMVL